MNFFDKLSFQSKKEKDIDSLFETFNHPNPIISNQAVHKMVDLYPEESFLLLSINLDAENVLLRRKSIQALSFFGDLIIEELRDLFLSTNNPILMNSCLKVFIKIIASGKYEIPIFFYENILNKVVKNEDPLIILSTISLLRQLDCEGLPYLLEMSKDKNILRAKAAISALIEINNPRVEDTLLEIMEGKKYDKFINNSALEALNIRKNNAKLI